MIKYDISFVLKNLFSNFIFTDFIPIFQKGLSVIRPGKSEAPTFKKIWPEFLKIWEFLIFRKELFTPFLHFIEPALQPALFSKSGKLQQ